MTVAIVTDSAAALPAALSDRHQVTVVPMYLTLGGSSYREGEQDFDVIEKGASVKTAGPTPGDFLAAVESRAGTDGVDGVVVLTIAATMSSTCEMAQVGAREATADVRVVDTGTAAGAEALVVLAAAEAAEHGGSLDEVAATAEAAAADVRLLATVPSLDHLVRSGRVPGIAGWAGRRLGISPLFEFRSGRARPLRPALSSEAAYSRMIAAVTRSRPDAARLHVAALHTRAPQAAEALLDAVTEGQEVATSFLGNFGAVMEVHIGPGLVGIAWRWERCP